MNIDDTRWKQRFNNLTRALNLLREIADYDIDALKPLEQEGFIQRFEYTLELLWKTLKDYLEEQGSITNENSPKPIFKTAFEVGIIPQQNVFCEMTTARNLLSHTYNFNTFKTMILKIKTEFLPEIEALYDYLLGKFI